MTSAPNLVALLGQDDTQRLLAVPGVSLLTLLRSNPAAIMHVGKPASGSAAAAASSENSNNNTQQQQQATTTNTGGLIFRFPDIEALPPSVRVKGAKILATAIKSAAGADSAKNAADGSVGRDQLAHVKKRLENLIPMVDFVDEDDQVLAIPDAAGGAGGGSKNSKHRAGQKNKKQRRIDEIDQFLASRLARCTTDEEKEAFLKSREAKAQLSEKDRLMTAPGAASSSNGAPPPPATQQLPAHQQQRRQRDDQESAAAAAANQVDDEYGDL